MDEYKFFKDILSVEFCVKNQKALVEDGVQHISISSDGKGFEEYSLYRFDLKENEFLPFFNKTHNAPKNLRAFCDYILLAIVCGKLYILLIELKSGGAEHVSHQLDAGEDFIRYITARIERIKKANNRADAFDVKNINIRKVVVKNLSLRPATKGKINNLDFQNGHYIYKTKSFDIVHICRCNLAG